MAKSSFWSTNWKNWSAVSLGVVIGVIAASVYWNSRQERSKFMFDHNVKCQQIAKQYETETTWPASKIIKVTYSPERNSCVAEVMKGYGPDTDYTLEDLLSGDSRFVFHHNLLNSGGDLQQMLSDYDAQFANFAHNPKYKPSTRN